MQIDAHQHFWDYAAHPDDFTWMGGEYASLGRDCLPGDLEPVLIANGIAGTVAAWRGEAEAGDGTAQSVVVESRIMRDADAAGGEIHPGGGDAGDGGKARFEFGDATGAAQALDGEDTGQRRSRHAGTSAAKAADLPAALTSMRT